MNKLPRWVRTLVAAATVAALLASCTRGGEDVAAGDPAATPARGGTLHVADEGEAITLNPFVAQDNLSQRAFAQVLEPLFRTDGDGRVVPWLVARSAASKDFRTWTFELRPGVRFSDGTPMRAADVVYSLDTIRKVASWKALYAEIKSVEATSPSTVVVRTAEPSPALRTSLSLPFAAVAPKDLAGRTPEEFGQRPIGTGPFRVESWQHGQRLTLVRNRAYWQPGRPYLDKVVFDAVPSDSSRAQQLRAGELDLAAAPPNPQLDGLDRGSTRVDRFAMAFPSYLLLNHESAAFADPRVREAADLAVDRRAILTAAGSGVGQLGASFLAPALQYSDDSLRPVARNPGRARSLLRQAVADGVDPTFVLDISGGDSYANLAAQIIQQNLQDVGFTVRLQKLDGSALLSQVAGGSYDATLFTMTSDIRDPSEVIGFYLDLNALWTGGETKRVRSLLVAAKQEPDPETRRALYRKIQRIVYEDRGLVVLGYAPWIWARRGNVVGFELAPTGVPWLADVGFRET